MFHGTRRRSLDSVDCVFRLAIVHYRQSSISNTPFRRILIYSNCTILRVTMIMMFIAVMIICQIEHGQTSSLVQSNSSFGRLVLPDEIQHTILSYRISTDQLLSIYFASYHRMNETQRKRRNKLIEWIINELTFDQSLSLSSFLNQQPFDDDAKRLQRDVMCTTQRLIKQELNHRIHNHTNVVPLPYPSGTVKIVFDRDLQDIFEKLHELNIQVNGTVSLQQLCGCPLVEIEHLDLCYNGIRSLDLFSDLAECKALKSLSLYQNKLSDINALRRVTGSQLETLHLVSNMVTNIEPLRGFSQLKTLYLEGNNI
eukprot:361683_1